MHAAKPLTANFHGDDWEMSHIEADILKLGGFAKASELARLGYSPDSVFAAVQASRILRVRKGWYADSDCQVPSLRAFRIGGKLTCVSGSIHHGLWVPEHLGLHVAVPRRASRLRTADDFRKRLAAHPDDAIVVHWSRSGLGGDRHAVSIVECIVRTFACQGRGAGFVVFKSALRKRKLTQSDRTLVFNSLKIADRPLGRIASTRSDSGTESIMKLHLHALGLRFTQQAFVGGVGPLDFLIGERLVIEVDSREFHSDPYRDRQKDAALSARGCRVLRFMYSQVVYEWPTVEGSILAAVSRGDHQPG